MDINGSPQVFQYPFDKQECEGTILLPWKNNYTVALATGSDPVKILGEVVVVVVTWFMIFFVFRRKNSSNVQSGKAESGDQPDHDGEHLQVLHQTEQDLQLGHHHSLPPGLTVTVN